MGSPDTDPSTRIYVTAAQEDPAWERWRQDREGKKPSEGDVSGEVPAPAWSCWGPLGWAGRLRVLPDLTPCCWGLPTPVCIRHWLGARERRRVGGDLPDSSVVQWLSSGEDWARRSKDPQMLVERRGPGPSIDSALSATESSAGILPSCSPS